MIVTLDDETLDETYEPFSREPEYVDVNQRFIDTLDLSRCRRVLDLACGTSTLAPMLLNRMPGSGAGRLTGLDLAHDGLTLGRAFVADAGARGTVDYVQASAACLPFRSIAFDAVVLGNAVQLIDPKDVLMAEVARVLRGGGIFAFNTSFYAGSYLPETERFYLQWIQNALEYIRGTDADLRRRGLPGVTRKKGLGRPAFTQPWLSTREYCNLLESRGFEVLDTRERIVMLTQRCFETIGAYAGMARVLLSGYPVRLACLALAHAAEPALATAGMSAVPRKWLEVVALRTRADA